MIVLNETSQATPVFAFLLILRQMPGAPELFRWTKKGQNPVLPVEQVISYIQGMSIDQIAAEALRLPPNERAMLAESLWESLRDPFKIPAESDDTEAIALALERDRQLEAGEVQPLSHEELMSRLRR